MAEPAQEATLRFRLYDGTDLGPLSFPLSTAVGALKEAVLLEWPQACALQACAVRLRPPDVALLRPSL
jgi:hypothetical protein